MLSSFFKLSVAFQIDFSQFFSKKKQIAMWRLVYYCNSTTSAVVSGEILSLEFIIDSTCSELSDGRNVLVKSLTRAYFLIAFSQSLFLQNKFPSSLSSLAIITSKPLATSPPTYSSLEMFVASGKQSIQPFYIYKLNAED